MSGAHTPGPWAIDPLGVECIGDVSTLDGTQCVAQAQQIAGDDIRQNTRRANTRLIAAAPELLEALQDMLKASQPQRSDIPGFVYIAEAQEAAMQAIAKATGAA